MPNTTINKKNLRQAQGKKTKASSAKNAQVKPEYFNVDTVENIEITFVKDGKLYALEPKQGNSNADINIKSALLHALDTHKAIEIIDADVQKLEKTLKETV